MEISQEVLDSLVDIGVQKAKLGILVDDYRESKKQTDDNLKRIYDLLRKFPEQIKECRDELETDTATIYMTKNSGDRLEERVTSNIRSIKLWIVSSVGGFSASGIFIIYMLKLVEV